MAAVSFGPNLSLVGNLIDNPVELNAPQGYYEVSSTRQPLPEVVLAEENLYGLHPPIDMEAGIDATFGKIHSCIATL